MLQYSPYKYVKRISLEVETYLEVVSVLLNSFPSIGMFKEGLKRKVYLIKFMESQNKFIMSPCSFEPQTAAFVL